MKKVYFFIYLLCISILVGAFALTYYINNVKYNQYINNFTDYQKDLNRTWYDIALEGNNNNLKYNTYLILIIKICIAFIIIGGIGSYVLRLELPKYSKNISKDLNTETNIINNGSGGIE